MCVLTCAVSGLIRAVSTVVDVVAISVEWDTPSIVTSKFEYLTSWKRESGKRGDEEYEDYDATPSCHTWNKTKMTWSHNQWFCDKYITLLFLLIYCRNSRQMFELFGFIFIRLLWLETFFFEKKVTSWFLSWFLSFSSLNWNPCYLVVLSTRNCTNSTRRTL